MIYIAYGVISSKYAPRQYIKDIDGCFDGFFEDKWMQNDIAKRAILEIDKSELAAPKVINSPILGQIPYTWISGGSKLLIMMNSIQDVVYDGDNLGDNCWPLFLEIGKEKDIAITLSYYPSFNWVPEAKVTDIDTGVIMNSFEEFRDNYLNTQYLYAERKFDGIAWPININYDRFKQPEIDF